MIKAMRNILLVKRVETEDRLASGLIAPSMVVDAWTKQQFEVVDVGPPAYYAEDGALRRFWRASDDWDDVPSQLPPHRVDHGHAEPLWFWKEPDDIKVGSWIFADWLSMLPVTDKLYVIRRDSVVAVLMDT